MEDQKFEVGERVWFQPLGWGDVSLISGVIYPIRVKFSNAGMDSFTKTGELVKGSGIQSLFRANSGVLKFDTTEIPDWPKDHPIWVRDSSDSRWVKRHFSHFLEGKAFCHWNGCTSHTDSDGAKTKWKYYTDVDPNKK